MSAATQVRVIFIGVAVTVAAVLFIPTSMVLGL